MKTEQMDNRRGNYYFDLAYFSTVEKLSVNKRILCDSLSPDNKCLILSLRATSRDLLLVLWYT